MPLSLKLDLVAALVIVAAYNLGALSLKRAIRRFDESSHPWRLQLKDFSLVLAARERASNEKDRRTLTGLFCVMVLTAASTPFVIVGWLLLSRVLRR